MTRAIRAAALALLVVVVMLVAAAAAAAEEQPPAAAEGLGAVEDGPPVPATKLPPGHPPCPNGVCTEEMKARCPYHAARRAAAAMTGLIRRERVEEVLAPFVSAFGQVMASAEGRGGVACVALVIATLAALKSGAFLAGRVWREQASKP